MYSRCDYRLYMNQSLTEVTKGGYPQTDQSWEGGLNGYKATVLETVILMAMVFYLVGLQKGQVQVRPGGVKQKLNAARGLSAPLALATSGPWLKPCASESRIRKSQLRPTVARSRMRKR